MKAKKNHWSPSVVEEAISALWANASLLAYIAGFKWLAFLLMIKAVMDTGCAIGYAIKETIQEAKKKRDQKP